MRTVAHLYDTYDHAQSVVTALESAGFSHDNVSIVANQGVADTYNSSTTATTGTLASDVTTAPEAATGAGTGASIGTIIGGGAGLLAGIGALAIPGIGPIVAAGWLVAALTGAGAGAAAGGLLGSLTGAGCRRSAPMCMPRACAAAAPWSRCGLTTPASPKPRRSWAATTRWTSTSVAATIARPAHGTASTRRAVR